jgi:hypothetical protein
MMGQFEVRVRLKIREGPLEGFKRSPRGIRTPDLPITRTP